MQVSHSVYSQIAQCVARANAIILSSRTDLEAIQFNALPVPTADDDSDLLWDIELKVPTIGTNEWEVLGHIDHQFGESTVIHYAAGMPERFSGRECPPNCDHCNTNRQRNRTIIIRQKDSGVVKQIGNSCVDNYTNSGISKLLNALAHLTGELNYLVGFMAAHLSDNYEPYQIDPDGVKPVSIDALPFSPFEIIAHAFSAIERDGKYHNVNSEYPTAARVRDSLMRGSSIKNRHARQAEAALQWAQSLKSTSTYQQNLQSIASASAVNAKRIGITVSIAASYLTHRDKEIANKALYDAHEHYEKTGDFLHGINLIVGNEGDKISAVKLSHIRTNASENQYGLQFYHTFKDDDNRLYTWKTTNDIPIEPRSSAYTSFTIKGHEKYQGKLYNQIIRPKFDHLNLIEKISLAKNAKAFNKLFSDPAIPISLKESSTNNSLIISAIGKCIELGSLEAALAITKTVVQTNIFDNLVESNAPLALKEAWIEICKQERPDLINKILFPRWTTMNIENARLAIGEEYRGVLDTYLSGIPKSISGELASEVVSITPLVIDGRHALFIQEHINGFGKKENLFFTDAPSNPIEKIVNERITFNENLDGVPLDEREEKIHTYVVNHFDVKGEIADSRSNLKEKRECNAVQKDSADAQQTLF